MLAGKTIYRRCECKIDDDISNRQRKVKTYGESLPVDRNRHIVIVIKSKVILNLKEMYQPAFRI